MTGEKKLRVRGGPKGVRFVTMSQWKGEIAERKGQLPPVKSHRQKKAEAKRKRKRA